MLPKLSLQLCTIQGAHRLEVHAAETPANSVLRRLGRGYLAGLPEAPPGATRLVLSNGDAALLGIGGSWPLGEVRTFRLVCVETLANGQTIETDERWVDLSVDAACSNATVIETLAVEQARQQFLLLRSPQFAVARLLQVGRKLGSDIRQRLETLAEVLAEAGDQRRFVRSTPEAIARKFIYDVDSVARRAVRAWNSLATATVADAAYESLSRPLGLRCTETEQIWARTLQPSASRPLHQDIEVVSQFWSINQRGFALLNALMLAHLDALEAIPPGDFVAAMREQFEKLYETVSRATSNTDVLGALVENRVREMIGAWVAPLRVSSGAIKSVGRGKQIDVIVWDNGAAPHFMWEGDVAVVDPRAVRGVLEIKTSESSIQDFAARLWEMQLDLSLFWRPRHKSAPPVFGLCVWDDDDYETVLSRSGGQMHTLLWRRDGKFSVNDPALEALVRFVFYRILGNQEFKTFPQL